MFCFVMALAKILDGLHFEDRVSIAEYDEVLIVSGVDFVDATAISSALESLGWLFQISDSEDNVWEVEQICELAEPFSIKITKPKSQNSVVNILTNVGFDQALKSGDHKKTLAIASIRKPFKSKSQLFTTWDSCEAFVAAEKTKSPRSLVKESTATRVTPEDINASLLQDLNDVDFDDPVVRIWANNAIALNVVSLANEVSLDESFLKFKGPPRLLLKYPLEQGSHIDELGVGGFLNLQEAVAWVYGSEREAEIKHSLLANEISRSGRELDSTLSYFKNHVADSLDSAKIAYQISISEVGRETIKSLIDLRKAVTEETSKVAESTRQIITAIAGSLAVGIGLIAARIASTDVSSFILGAVMFVAVAHVVMIFISGFGYILIQKKLRCDWQSRLYRFLPSSEYKTMVDEPTKKAEDFFYIVSVVGIFALLLLTLAVFLGDYGVVKPEKVVPVDSPVHAPASDELINEAIKGIQKIRDIKLPL